MDTEYIGPDRRQAEDPSVAVSAERLAEIDRLSRRVEQLVGERSSSSSGIGLEHFLRLENNQGELSRQVARLEYAIFGAAGENGLSGRVRDLQTSIDKMRETEFADMKDAMDGLRTSIRLWILGLLPVLIAVVGIVIAFRG